MARTPGPPPAWVDLSCPPAALCDVLAALLAGADQALAADLAVNREPISALAMLVERHRLGCYLASRLESSPVQALLPAELWEAIQRRQYQQEQRTAAILGELRWLLPRFQAAGIEVMLLKGPELATRFHGGLHQRGYGDLDLLVRGRDRRATLKLLNELGYTLRSRVVLSRSLMATVNHGFDFERQGVRLDLHWCLSRQPGYRLDENGFWARRVPWTHDGVEVAVPHPTDELHLLLISAFADLQRGALRLQSLVDLRAVIEALHPFDQEAFLDERRQERTATVCYAMLEVQRLLLQRKPCAPTQTDRGPAAPEREHLLARLQNRSFPLSTKLWCARRLPVNLLHYSLWWLASLPMRAACSHPVLAPRSLSPPE